MYLKDIIRGGRKVELLDTIAGVIFLGAAFLFFTIINYRILFMKIRKDERIPSPTPFFGGIAGALLVYCLFRSQYPLLILLPLLIDPGSIPLIIYFFVCLIKE